MNLPPELVSRAHKIKLNSKKISTTLQGGSARSKKHGNGFSFDQLREYDLGDDIRFIDWKASARADSMLVKQFYEEKIKQVVLVTDLTGSARYSSQQLLRDKIIKLSGSLIALASGHAHDSFALISVGKTTAVRPMKSGLLHAYQCIDDLMNQQSGGDFSDVTSYIQQITRGNASLVVFISDMLIPDIERMLHAIAHKHDVLVIRCLDTLEHSVDLPIGLTVVDPETGYSAEIDSIGHQTAIRTALQTLYKKHESACAMRRISYLDLRISNNALDELLVALS